MTLNRSQVKQRLLDLNENQLVEEFSDAVANLIRFRSQPPRTLSGKDIWTPTCRNTMRYIREIFNERDYDSSVLDVIERRMEERGSSTIS